MTLEELQLRSPALGAGFVRYAPPDFLVWLDARLAEQRSAFEAVTVPAEPMEDGDPELEHGPGARLAAAVAPLPDLSWLRVLHTEHEAAARAFKDALRSRNRVTARVEAQGAEYQEVVRRSIVSGAPSPPPLDGFRAQVEVDVAGAQVGVAGVALAKTAHSAIVMLKKRRADLNRVVDAAETCAAPGTATQSQARAHPLVQRIPALLHIVDLVENQAQIVRRFADAASELEGYSAASARRTMAGAIAGV